MPFDKPLKPKQALWLEGMSNQDKLEALAQIHEFTKFRGEKATQEFFEEYACVEVEEFGSVFWGATSYGLWGKRGSGTNHDYTREEFLEVVDRENREIVQWLSTPTRIIDFNTVAQYNEE